ncbi:DUF397 domain-containing protein [Thermobifida cellulosilytica]|uniref:DUF397 domain-containing protein n=1 Tax=Thermobifida cellulosilytica TaxID=144786 RepID=UPI000AC5AF83|nr:DUF397 domain-containing protein [Thermobifida cellulosilytica]
MITEHTDAGFPPARAAALHGATSWRKSSYSDTGKGTTCVEVRFAYSRSMEIRDSVHPGGPVLAVSARAWILFIRQVKQNSL